MIPSSRLPSLRWRITRDGAFTTYPKFSFAQLILDSVFLGWLLESVVHVEGNCRTLDLLGEERRKLSTVEGLDDFFEVLRTYLGI